MSFILAKRRQSSPVKMTIGKIMIMMMITVLHLDAAAAEKRSYRRLVSRIKRAKLMSHICHEDSPTLHMAKQLSCSLRDSAGAKTNGVNRFIDNNRFIDARAKGQPSPMRCGPSLQSAIRIPAAARHLVHRGCWSSSHCRMPENAGGFKNKENRENRHNHRANRTQSENY